MKLTRVKKNVLAGLALAAAFVCAGAICSLPSVGAGALSRDTASLFLPSSYEQYLELAEPKDVAVSETHIAIADGNKIYLYTRGYESYRTFTYGMESATFGKIQLYEDLLYFTDAAMSLHRLDPDAEDLKGSVEDIGYSLANFIIADGKIYGTTTMGTRTSLYVLALNGSTDINYTDPLVLNLSAQLPMTYADGVFYYAEASMVYPIFTENDEKGTGVVLARSDVPIRPNFICAAGGLMYYTDDDGFYRSDLAGEVETVDRAEGYTALTSCGDKLYCVRGDAVLEYSTSEHAFTDYEITSSSPSVNRLSGAVDTARAGDLLVTADAGNRRVSVYRLSTGEYTEILPPDDTFTPTLVATDGELIAVSDGSVICTCSYGDERLVRAHATQSAVRGLACVYGTVYYVTGNIYGRLGDEPTEAFHDRYGTPAALASDLYGDLFVAYETTRTVVRFTEAEFATDGGGEKLDVVLPEGYASLRADFEGNLYCLTEKGLMRAGEEEPLASLRGRDFAYTMSEDDPASFALGFEDDEVYFLFGDYIVKSERGAIDIPALNEISAEGVREAVFQAHGKDRLFIDIPVGSCGIRTDLDGLKADAADGCFPYEFYFRTQKAIRGVLLAEKDGYALTAVYEDDRTFTANLFRLETEECLVPQEEYWQAGEGELFLTNAVSSYFFPCLPDALADVRLARGARVTVLGTVEAPERSYALVEYAAEGGSARGFVPTAYLTEVDPLYDRSGNYLLGMLKKDVVLTADDGEELALQHGTQVRLYDNGDGTYTAAETQDGKEYRLSVPEEMIDWGESDALRISLIVVLSVLAVLIVGVYIYLLPRKQRK